MTLENANTLAALIGRSKKCPMLINEAVVTLSFLTAHERGGEFLPAFVRQSIGFIVGVIVLDAIMSPLPVEVKQGKGSIPPNATGSDEGSPVVGPTHAINGLASLLKLSNS